MEKKIGDIAEQIASRPDKKIVMIAGSVFLRKDYLFPSSFHSVEGEGLKAASNRGGQLFCEPGRQSAG